MAQILLNPRPKKPAKCKATAATAAANDDPNAAHSSARIVDLDIRANAFSPSVDGIRGTVNSFPL
jgi:hypothetical protein